MPVPKDNGSIRLCGDYKTTISPVLLVDQYPVPKPADLFATLDGWKFSKIDVANVDLHMALAQSSQDLVTNNTQCRLYTYTHFPFSLVSAPAVTNDGYSASRVSQGPLLP